ncbi:MAG: GspH/FimT family pseudopilin [Deltaproteobacteria bacterium]|nr:GspH/FimT family pseudopilin [Deltaproteobacteria bacterium]
MTCHQRSASACVYRRVRLRHPAGFSLPELLVTVSLFAILIGTAAPYLPAFTRTYNLTGAAHEIFSALQRARMTAILANRHCRFVVIGSRSYRIHIDSNGNGVEDTGEPITTQDITQNTPGITLDGANGVTFAPNGSAPPGGTITLTNSNGKTKQVVVAATGQVQVN